MKLDVVCISLLAAVVSAVKVNPLPAPRSVSWGESGEIEVNDLKLIGHSNQLIEGAFERMLNTLHKLKYTPQAIEEPFQPILRPGETVDNSTLQKRSNHYGNADHVRVNVDDLNADLQMGVDESYTLNVTEKGILIDAATIWGALHAFSTLQQLVIYDDHSGLVIEQPVSIADEPLYSHRGVMVDSARNFLDVPSILRQVDALSLSKMNVLHWHFSDSQSWPIQLDSVPEMIKGAFSPREIYSKRDVAHIVNYARERGVRVIPEVDSPGHSYKGWNEVDPELLACATSKYSNNINHYQLDIMNDKVYDYVEKVHDELSDMFPDNVFHIGADELEKGCFNYSTKIQEWFKEDPSRTDNDLLDQWFEKSLPIFTKKKDRRLMVWSDAVLSPDVKANNVPKDVILQCWKDDNTSIPTAIDMGYDVIASQSNFVYLDCGYGLFLTGKDATSWCDPYKSWQTIYNYNFTEGLTAEQAKKVLGAEAALFGEQVDSTVLDQKIWPRTAALAELTWSGNKHPDGTFRIVDMGQRINNFREYLVANGISAPPLMPKYCVQNAHDCDYDVYLSHN